MKKALLIAGLLCLTLLAMAAEKRTPAQKPAQESQLLAPDGVPYDNEGSWRLMQRKALSGNLLRNGSLEAGRYWPYGWQATDGLTTFWAAGGTHGKLCLRIYTDVLEAQWKRRHEEVRAAAAEAGRVSGGDPQALPENPIPEPPERTPTSPPYYDTVAGLHGVHYRSAYIPVTPRAIYRFSIDARTTTEEKPHEPMVFIKGFFDQKMETKDGVRTVRRDAYRAPMTLDPCDRQWRRYARVFHPWQSKSTLGDRPLRPQHLQVQIYAYWRPGDYYFDNARLEIIGMEEPGPEEKPEKPERPQKKQEPPRLDERGYPIFSP